MKKKVKEITEICLIAFIGFMVMMLITFCYFFIRVSYFPQESIYPDVSIEEQIRNEKMLF